MGKIAFVEVSSFNFEEKVLFFSLTICIRGDDDPQ